jgi:DNA primase
MEPEDYLILMLSMKAIGKRVDLGHIIEKTLRDLKGIKREEIEERINKLVSEGLVNREGDLYSASARGREWFKERIEEVDKELRKINEPWVIVYEAKQYYPKVAPIILDFCKDRWIGFYCLFTEKRFFRRDFKGRKIKVSSLKDLMFYVNMHYVDVIPCVHRIGMQRPDWLVVDIDAGPKVSFEKTKEVTKVIYEVFQHFKLNPALKFSGSRGFQVWSLIEPFPFPDTYVPLRLPGESKRERNYFSLFSDLVRIIQKEVDKQIPGITLSDVGEKETRTDKILLDSSSMKPMGLVRAPYGLHSKTGLISKPLSLEVLDEFKPLDASPTKVSKRYEERGDEFKLVPSDPLNIINRLVKGDG